MSQIPRCSQHHIPLVIERRSLSFLGFTDMTTTGRCAKCDVIYISHRIMGCERISIDRQKYVYCEDLSDNSLNIAQAGKEEIVFEQGKNADLSDLKKENDGLRELLSQTNEQLEVLCVSLIGNIGGSYFRSIAMAY